MAQLAIKGHATRGREVINTLKMLGGKNSRNLLGDVSSSCYYIDSTGKIDYEHYSYFDDDMPFTLEKFLEKFPYKVGDKVQHKGATSCGSVFEVEKMRWEEDTVKYTLCLFGCNYKRSTLPAEYLQPYKEAPMYLNRKVNEQAEEIKKVLEPVKEIIEGVYAYNEINCYHQDFGDKVRIRLGNDFEIKVEDNKTYIVKKQPQYPKTYEECCKILNWNHRDYDRVGYNSELLCKLQVLLLCRDAYWKIAGEEMGLGKPWEPDWNNVCDKYTIYTVYGNVIWRDKGQTINTILAFPTAEMQDAFYENFKELIELCKEFL